MIPLGTQKRQYRVAIERVVQDARYGLRILVRNPGFAAVTIVMLALGIGVNTAIFSLINTVLLRSLPYPGANRLVAFSNGINRSSPEQLRREWGNCKASDLRAWRI